MLTTPPVRGLHLDLIETENCGIEPISNYSVRQFLLSHTCQAIVTKLYDSY